MTTPDLPPGLPPLPPVPAGFDRWIDRGTDWEAKCATYACIPLDGSFSGEWLTHYDAPAHGSPTHHYIEAVRDPAESPQGRAIKSIIESDLAEQITYALLPDASGDTVAKVARIIAEYEPAEVPASGVEAIATRQWCVKSAEIEDQAEVGAGTRTGVEARVCEEAPPAIWRTDYQELDGKMEQVQSRDLFMWGSVKTATGELDVSDMHPFDDELGKLAEGWEWRRFRLVEEPPTTEDHE